MAALRTRQLVDDLDVRGLDGDDQELSDTIPLGYAKNGIPVIGENDVDWATVPGVEIVDELSGSERGHAGLGSTGR